VRCPQKPGTLPVRQPRVKPPCLKTPGNRRQGGSDGADPVLGVWQEHFFSCCQLSTLWSTCPETSECPQRLPLLDSCPVVSNSVSSRISRIRPTRHRLPILRWDTAQGIFSRSELAEVRPHPETDSNRSVAAVRGASDLRMRANLERRTRGQARGPPSSTLISVTN